MSGLFLLWPLPSFVLPAAHCCLEVSDLGSLCVFAYLYLKQVTEG